MKALLEVFQWIFYGMLATVLVASAVGILILVSTVSALLGPFIIVGLLIAVVTLVLREPTDPG